MPEKAYLTRDQLAEYVGRRVEIEQDGRLVGRPGLGVLLDGLVDHEGVVREAMIACLAGITFGTLAVLVWNDAQKYPAMWADRALCESRGGVWLTAPVEPGCYSVSKMNEANHEND